MRTFLSNYIINTPKVGTNIHEKIEKELQVEVPKVITIELRQELFYSCRYMIGAGITKYIPSTNILYVIDTDKFGHAWFENISFYQGRMYIFEKDEEYKFHHDAEAVLATSARGTVMHMKLSLLAFVHPTKMSMAITSTPEMRLLQTDWD